MLLNPDILDSILVICGGIVVVIGNTVLKQIKKGSTLKEDIKKEEIQIEKEDEKKFCVSHITFVTDIQEIKTDIKWIIRKLENE